MKADQSPQITAQTFIAPQITVENHTLIQITEPLLIHTTTKL